MLIAYISKYKKIVMGLLTYIDEFKEMNNLNKEMDRIESGTRKIALWKDEETDNIVGLIGYDKPNKESNVLVRYLSISPSFRNEGLSYEMLNALANEYPENKITGTLDMSDLLSKWALHEQRTSPHIVDDVETGKQEQASTKEDQEGESDDDS